MGYLKEKVSYLKGLAEGMNIGDSTNEAKLLKAIIDVLDDVAITVEEIEEAQNELCEQVDDIDQDLGEVEKVLYDEECDDDCECGDDCDCDDEVDVECPYCNEVFTVNIENLDEENSEMECPNCKNKIEIDWECGCEDCSHD